MAGPDLYELLHALTSRMYGKYAGTVSDNADPQQLGRLQVLCPAVLGSSPVWALPCVPYAGPGVGFFMLPPVGAGVWVEFEAGDVGRPIWAGCYWASGQLPADASSADHKLIVTDQASLTIDDSSGEIVMKNAGGASVTWNSDVTTEAGSATHTVGAVGVVSESSPGKVEVGASGVTVNNGAFTVM